MIRQIRHVFVGLLAACLLVPISATATNGMFLIGYGAVSRGMGGVSYAMHDNSISAATNPAATGLLEGAGRVDMNGTVFNPSRSTECCLAPNGVKSGANWFLIPAMGGAYRFNRKLSVGFTAVGSGGGLTRYNENFFGGDATLGVALLSAVMSPVLSYRVTKDQSIGFSPVFMAQQFRAYGLQPFIQFSKDKENVTNRGNDYNYGGGVRLGYQGRFLKDRVSIGAAWQSRLYMTKLDKYRGLFAENGSLDGVENFGAGIVIRPLDRFSIAFDVQRYLNSDIKAIGNRSLPISVAEDSPNNLGRDDGPGFGWQDQTVYKLGLKFEYNPKWTFRAGFNYGKSPVRDDPGDGELEFNALAPAVVEKHITGGFTYRINKSSEVNFAAMHAFKNSQDVVIDSDTQLPFSGPIEIAMKQNAWDFGYTYKF
jgi:long-chain fatty acid transport protein